MALGGRTAKYQNRESPGKDGTPLILEPVENCLAILAVKGWVYRTYYRRLPPEFIAAVSHPARRDKTIRPGILRYWREHLLEGGYSPHGGQPLHCCGQRLPGLCPRPGAAADRRTEGVQEAPARADREYLRLLSTARALGKKRVYLLVKVFGNTDLPVHEVERLMVGIARAGMLRVGSGSSREIIRFPECICRELLDYAKQEKSRAALFSAPGRAHLWAGLT